MNQANQGNNPGVLADFPVKRKRGRPRKHPSINQGASARVPRDQSLNHGVYTRVPKDLNLNHRVPPGFEGNNGHQPCPVEPIVEVVDPMVGQLVSGIVEASFDAGYLLNVRVGDSETILRGVVFKPGHFLPVSMENDVAPDVGMIRRFEMPLPTENYLRSHGSNRNGTRSTFSDSTATKLASRAATPVSAKGKEVYSVANPVMSRGNVVPVVLQPTDQPIDLTNGLPPANQPSPVLVQTVPHSSSNGKQVPMVAPQAPNISGPRAIHQEVPIVVQNENGAGNDPSQVLHDTGIKSLEMTGMPMEKLLAEVIKRGQGHNMSPGNMDQPLTVEPLQAVQPHQRNHSAFATRPLEKERVGRMTELLQVVQEKMTENLTPQVKEPGTTSRPMEAGDNETVH